MHPHHQGARALQIVTRNPEIHRICCEQRTNPADAAPTCLRLRNKTATRRRECTAPGRISRLTMGQIPTRSIRARDNKSPAPSRGFANSPRHPAASDSAGGPGRVSEMR